MQLPSRWWWDLSTREFAEIDMSQVVAVLPVAAVEQHGPHLPVRVDAALNEGIVARAAERMPADLPALFLPMLPVGKSAEHISYPGTLTLSYETLARVWYEVGESVRRTGCRRIVFWNSHGGQPQVMEIVCRELRLKLGMLAVSASWFGVTPMDDLFTPREQMHGIHGGELETSAMLATRPDLVKMEYADNFKQLSEVMEQENEVLRPDGGAGFGWISEDLHPAGVSGNAAAADAARGHAVMDRAATRLVQIVREAHAFPISRFDAAPAWPAPFTTPGSRA